MKNIEKLFLIPLSLVGLLTSCGGPEVYNERIKNYINEKTNKTSQSYQYYSTYDSVTKVSTKYFVYYNFQREYSGLFMTSTTGGLETGIELTLPTSNSSTITIFMLEYYNSVATFNAEAIIKPSSLTVGSKIYFTDIISADEFAQKNIDSYNERMSLGVHLNLMNFEKSLGHLLDFSLKDWGFVNYYSY
jgi:hypothetical protein